MDLIFSAYLRGQILVSLFLTLFYFSSFYIIGLNYSLFIGIFAGFFSFIPLIGIIVSFFITALLAYLQFLEIFTIFYILLIFLAAQLLESNYLTPKLIGKRLGLHPSSSIILYLCVWCFIWYNRNYFCNAINGYDCLYF